MSKVRGCSQCCRRAVPGCTCECLSRSPREPVPSPAARNKDTGNAASKGLLQAPLQLPAAATGCGSWRAALWLKWLECIRATKHKSF